MTPIYDALRAAPPRSTETDAQSAPKAADRSPVRLTLAPAAAPTEPAAFPVRVLRTPPRTPPWRTDLLP